MLHPEMAYVSQPLRRASFPGVPSQGGPGIMDSMKDWFMNKCRDPSPPSHPDSGMRGKVVTPSNIPEFTIPLRSVDNLPRHGPDSPHSPHSPEFFEGQSHSSGSQPCSNHTSPRASPSPLQRGSSPCLGLPQTCPQSRSAPVSPCRSSHAERQQSFTYEGGRKRADTNVDPMSIAALSLPHLKVKTEFGFATLSECPHTRRKESLFQSGLGVGDPLLPMSLRAHSVGVLPTANKELSVSNQHDSDLRLRRRSTGNRRRNVPSVVAPLGVVHPQWSSNSELRVRMSLSTECSPPNTPEMERQSLRRSKSVGRQVVNSNKEKVYFRRRSSIPKGSEDCQCNSSAEPSPASRRRSSASGLDPALREHLVNLTHGVNSDYVKPRARSSSPISPGGGHLPASTSVNSEMSSSCSCNSVSRLEAQMIAELGELKFSMQYVEKRHELRVLLIRAENLASHKSPTSVHAYAKLYLLPGKSLKKTSSVIRATRDPVFNQEFIFSNIPLDQLRESRLKIKIHSKGQLKRDEFLGQVQVALESFDLLSETRLWKNLEPKYENEDSGYLQVSVCFTPSSEGLQVNIIQARDLPKHVLTGTPDPYVKVILSVPGRTDQKKQTRTHRKSVDPQFQEDFKFQISPKIGDLDYTTLTLTVFSHERLRSDDAIGQVRLGYGATEVTEFDHWNQVLQNPGVEYTNWHILMESETD